MRESWADVAGRASAIGYEPRVGFEEGLRRTIDAMGGTKGATMSYGFGTIEELGYGYGFRKVRQALGVEAFGVNVIVMPPGYLGFHHYHDEQDELYFVHAGTARVEVERRGATAARGAWCTSPRPRRAGLERRRGRPRPARRRRQGRLRLPRRPPRGRRRPRAARQLRLVGLAGGARRAAAGFAAVGGLSPRRLCGGAEPAPLWLEEPAAPRPKVR